MGDFQIKQTDSKGGVTKAMKLFIKSRLLWLVVGLTAFFTSLSYLNNAHSALWPESTQLLKLFLYTVQLPSIFIGILVSKNFHAPNATVTYIALFFTYLIVFWGLIALFRIVYTKTKRKPCGK